MSNNVYLGNPNLKKANTQIEFTQENILEFLKCKDDPVYFARKYIKIVSLDEGLVPFNLYDFQENWFVIFMRIVLIFVRCQDKLVNLQHVYLTYYTMQFLMKM